MKILKLFLITFLLFATINCNSYVKTDQTEIVSILNEATYYSIDQSYGNSEKQRVQNRINELKETFPQTSQALQNVEVLQSTEKYTIFINQSNKQIYLAIRGTVPTKGSDLKNDLQMFLNKTPERVQEINEVMRGKMTELANQGYSVNVSGHSLGGSLALFACADNSWVNHCEVHNPYLDDSLINKLKPVFDSKGMNTKVVIQETLNDFVSQHFPTTSLNVTYSVFELVQNVKGIGEHSSLGLFAKSFLEGDQQINFDYPSNTTQEFSDFVNLCKSKFEEFLNIISQCQENQYYNFSSLACIACPVSQSCRNNFLGPYNCPPSQIATSSGQCQFCSAGTYVSDIGKNTCFQCPVGHKCLQGIKTPCSPGTYTNYINDTECYNCRSGQYQSQSGQTQCYTCPLGHICPSTTSDPIPCSPGTYRDIGDDNKKCTVCQKDTYQLKSGQTSCESCPTGYICPSTTSEPIPCPPGTYQYYYEINRCYPCGQGRYQLKSGQTSCEYCPTGYACPSTTSEPIPCPPGTYDYYDECQPCDQGTYQLESRQTSCSSCPVGYICPSTTEKPIACPPGTYNNYNNQTKCTPCEEGTYQLENGKTKCNMCPVGHMCPSTTKEPVICPPGTYNYSNYNTQCSPCIKGNFQLESGQTKCNQCPVGHMCPLSTQEPILCPLGTYNRYTNNYECYNCPQGYVSKPDRSECIRQNSSLLQRILLKKKQINELD